MNALHDKAIQAALAGDWETAVECNLEILATQPKHIPTLNRLGRAYMELGQKESSKDAYEQVLKIDKYDVIASKNLKLLPHQKCSQVTELLSDEDFIELPGITKSTSLIKVASRDVLLSLSCKQKLVMTPKSKLIALQTLTKLTIGYLPDDLSHRLLKLLGQGYEYSTCIKGTSDNSATIFIREIKRPKKPTASATFSRNNQLLT